MNALRLSAIVRLQQTTHVAVQIIFVGQHRWRAQLVFNANAYPMEVRSVVDACASRYALLLRHNSTMHDALDRDTSDFMGMVEAQRADLENALRSRPDLSSVAVYDGLAHPAEMHRGETHPSDEQLEFRQGEG